MSSNHGRSRLARLALAAGGVGTLIAAAALARYAASSIGGGRGTYVTALLAAGVFAACGLAHGLRRYRPAKPSRPAPVRLPGRDRHLEPAA